MEAALEGTSQRFRKGVLIEYCLVGMEKKLKNVIGASLGKTAVAYVTHLELKFTEEEDDLDLSESANHQEGFPAGGSRATSVFEWLRQLLTLYRFYKRKENLLVSVKDIHRIPFLIFVLCFFLSLPPLLFILFLYYTSSYSRSTVPKLKSNL
jgi:hypothetical protein